MLDHLANGTPPPLFATLAIGSDGSLQLADHRLRCNALCARLLHLGSRHRSVLIVAAHVIAFATIYPLAFLVRFDLDVPPMVWWFHNCSTGFRSRAYGGNSSTISRGWSSSERCPPC